MIELSIVFVFAWLAWAAHKYMELEERVKTLEYKEESEYD